jgi:PAS domain S-box-containing protein
MIHLFRMPFSAAGALSQRDGYHLLTGVAWLEIDANALVALTSCWIAIMLVHIARKRGDSGFGRVLVSFGIFFFACGAVQVVEIWNPWHSDGWLLKAASAAMALASAVAALLLARLAPKALALPSPTALKWLNTELEQEIANRRQAEEHAQKLNAELEERVAQRTAELIAGNREQLRQIAQRKLADERFRLVVEASPNAIVLANATGRILLINSSAENLFGFNREELMGKPFATLLPERFRAAYCDGPTPIPHHWGRSALEGDLFALRKDGSETPIEMGRSPIETAEGALMLSTIVDISRRRQAEQEVQKLNENLEQRVNERTAQLEAANKELEAFSYSVSHDLRAPLRAVDGFSQAVLEDYATQLPEDCARYLRRIRAGAQTMGNLIDDLLTLSRLSRAPLSKRMVDTGILVRGVVDDLQSQPNAKKVEVRIGELPSCLCDPALLKQVWINLLSNALKYTLKRESPLVEVGCTRGREGNVYFVRDNGAGFDMRYVNKLFGVFQRLHRAEDYEGTGVGLAIVQRIVQRHGGRVWAEAEVDRGAAFYFTLEEQTPS